MATLNEKIGLARALFGTDRTDAPSVNRISGTATADSSDGTVTVQLEDGDIVELGCIGSVRQGQTVTVHVQGASAQVVAAEGWGDSLQESVDEAVEVATATGQHFWDDGNGAHVTEVTREDWETSPSGFNALWNSLGLLFRKALSNLVAITQSAVTFYDGQGNNAANVTASFGSSGAQIGKTGDSHLVMDSRTLSLVDMDGTEFFKATDTRGADGIADYVLTILAPGNDTGFVVNPTATSTSTMTVSVSDGSGGTVTKATNYITFSSAPTAGAVITVSYKTSSAQTKGYTLGTRASSTGIGLYSTAEGYNVAATGAYSHAEGEDTVASGYASHAQNIGTIAADQYQTAMGMYNEATYSRALVIGNGMDEDNRSNAFEVGWSGLVTMGGTPFYDMFTIETHSSEAIGSIAANGTRWVTVDCTKTGYKLLGPIGYYINGATALTVYACNRSSTTECQAALRNPTSSASSANAKLEIQALYVKVL